MARPRYALPSQDVAPRRSATSPSGRDEERGLLASPPGAPVYVDVQRSSRQYHPPSSGSNASRRATAARTAQRLIRRGGTLSDTPATRYIPMPMQGQSSREGSAQCARRCAAHRAKRVDTTNSVRQSYWHPTVKYLGTSPSVLDFCLPVI